MNIKMYAYNNCTPMDIGWELFHTFEDFIILNKKLAIFDEELLEINCQIAMDAFSELAGVDSLSNGFIRRPLRIFFFPYDYSPAYGFIIKVDNNGDTFVVSDHLTDDFIGEAKIVHLRTNGGHL